VSIESPEYEIVTKDGALEVRNYAPYVTASAHVRADGYDEATRAGFGVLADYIFGNNSVSGTISMTAPVTSERARGEKIAMTAPVTSQRARNEQMEPAKPLCTVRCPGEYVVSFSMPSRFRAVEELPEPNDSRVILQGIPAHLAATARFSGRLDDEAVTKAIAKLQDWIERQGLAAAGDPVAAQYDAPWIPGFARHNEVLIPVAKR
jgi:hypothetical protein